MIKADNTYLDIINGTARSIVAEVELNGSTFTHNGALQSFTVERVADPNKLFGFGVCQKLNTNLIDKERTINVEKGQTANIAFLNLRTCPTFYVEEVQRDENNNNLAITAYDAIFQASNHTASELNLPESYTIREVAEMCAALLGVGLNILSSSAMFDVSYSGNANIEGTETIREILDDIAEATGTIYFINNLNELVFKRLDIDGAPVYHIDKTKYFELSSGAPLTITSVVKATALEDNVSVGPEGGTQYLRDNIFLDLRDDVVELLESILTQVQGLTIEQFVCKWRQNFLLEIGDKISFEAKDGSVINTYLLSDTLTYNGGMVGVTQWEHSEQSESSSNPSTIGDALKYTYAKVDKVNKEIELVASDVSNNAAQISGLKVTTDNITASVERADSKIDSSIDNMNDNMALLTKKIEAKMSAEDVQLQISEALGEGVSAVTTSTGFTFNEEGLTISKSTSPIATTITENGMTVSRSETDLLKCNADGVTARNLHANTYLIVGLYSRFENYGERRTGCFWIGE